ncbi:hypothetical protein [Tepidicaulis sp.]|uniref:hypothetical protein n=1 Tax=Tepidicaulis sp. TaxID=1920809 RepID=UPI003B5996A8
MSRFSKGSETFLELATPESFGQLKDEWASQAIKYDDDSYAEAYLQHAESIIAKPCEGRPRGTFYGIFILKDSASNCLGMAHFNRAQLPKTAGWTLRTVWVQLAPKYDYEELTEQEAADIVAGLLFSAIKLCREGELKSDHLKVHLQNSGDRQLAMGLARALENDSPETKVSVRGNWLHFDNVA